VAAWPVRLIQQSSDDEMLRQFLVGGGASLVNFTIQALVMTTVVQVARAGGARKILHPSLFLLAVMIPTVSVLMITHVVEVMVWSLVYWTLEAAPPGTNLTDFAFVNYTTLGYGDVLPTQDWRWLGPIAAMNGILLFGWSTAIIFEVLRRALARIGNISSE
jgi:Ion channel